MEWNSSEALAKLLMVFRWRDGRRWIGNRFFLLSRLSMIYAALSRFSVCQVLDLLTIVQGSNKLMMHL